MFFFPDTHFFLHFKHAQELPWSDVTEADPIHLIVGRAVQKEIEKHKYELRGRPQDRARDYAAKLAKVALNDQSVTLRDKKPRVFLDYRVSRPAGWSVPAELDPSWGDDMLVERFHNSNPIARPFEPVGSGQATRLPSSDESPHNRTSFMESMV